MATPRHLKKHGTTKRPSDPGGDNPLIWISVQSDDFWRFRSPRGEAATVPVPVSGRLRFNILSAVLAAARAHLGVAALP